MVEMAMDPKTMPSAVFQKWVGGKNVHHHHYHHHHHHHHYHRYCCHNCRHHRCCIIFIIVIVVVIIVIITIVISVIIFILLIREIFNESYENIVHQSCQPLLNFRSLLLKLCLDFWTPEIIKILLKLQNLTP